MTAALSRKQDLAGDRLRRSRFPQNLMLMIAFPILLAGGATLRFWSLATRPGWQYDEAVYVYVGSNLLNNGTINEHITYGSAWTPDLYEPPYYFITLAKWFWLTGESIYHARVLGVLFSLGTLFFLWRLLVRIRGSRVALYAMAPIVFDGWLLYIQRVSYMENLLLMLITAGLLLYQRALDTPAWWRFAIAGLALGAAVAVKYTGVSVLVAVLLCWLILRQSHRGHLIMVGSALLVLGGSIALQASWFDVPGHDWWLQQNLVQVRRVLGLQQSGGTLTSPTAALHLLFAQYDVFAFSFAVAAIAIVMVVRRFWACYRTRSWQPVDQNALLWSWMVSGLVVFGVSSLKFPQYFALILVPMYAWFWTETRRWTRWSLRSMWVLIAVAVLAGLASFYGRVATRSDNVFADMQAYANGHLPANAVVLADESTGDLIEQQYCREQNAASCLGVATYAITTDTYLQTTWDLGDVAYRQMMQGAVPVKSWTGFNMTITVWRLRN